MSFIVQTTHRAYIGADSNVVLWVRDEAGKRDFGGTVEDPAALDVAMTPYSRNAPEIALQALSTEPGRVAFTVTEDMAEQQLAPGLFSFRVKSGNEVVAQGLLEVVG